MKSFNLKNHFVEEASFVENVEKEKKKNIEVSVEGGILIPKEKEKKVIVKLSFHLGKETERMNLFLKTVSFFEVVGDGDNTITEEEVHNKCLPIALSQLRKTIKNVMVAYGRPGLDLPPFEGENMEG